MGTRKMASMFLSARGPVRFDWKRWSAMLWGILVLERCCHYIDKTRWNRRMLLFDILLCTSHPSHGPFLQHGWCARDRGVGFRLCCSFIVSIICRLSWTRCCLVVRQTVPVHLGVWCTATTILVLDTWEGAQNKASHRWMEEHALASPSEGLMEVSKKPRWKPTPAQMTILEGFFAAGHVKATSELLVAVQAAGEATETQVSVWMKNRMARAKKKTGTNGPGTTREMEVGTARHSAIPQPSGTTGRKRLRDSEFATSLQVRDGEVYARAYAVCEQVCDVLGSVADEQAYQLMSLVRGAKHVFCYGVGREGLVIRSFAMRLYHLGKQVSVVGDMNCPPVSAGDLLFVSAGPGYFSTVVALAEQARRNGGHILVVTASSHDIDWADTVVQLGAAQTLPPNVHHSGGEHLDIRHGVEVSFQEESPRMDNPLVMGSSFEISLWVLLDCVVSILQQQWGIQSVDMVQRHTNLE